MDKKLIGKYNKALENLRKAREDLKAANDGYFDKEAVLRIIERGNIYSKQDWNNAVRAAVKRGSQIPEKPVEFELSGSHYHNKYCVFKKAEGLYIQIDYKKYLQEAIYKEYKEVEKRYAEVEYEFKMISEKLLIG